MSRSEGGRRKGGGRRRRDEERAWRTKLAWMDCSSGVIIQSNKLAQQRTKKKKEKGRRFANVRLLITHPCTAHVRICMHFPRKPLYYHKSFSGGGSGAAACFHARALVPRSSRFVDRLKSRLICIIAIY